MSELIKNTGELMKSIDAWGKRGKKWLVEGQHLAMSALSILAETGDIMPANRLYLAMPKGSKTGAMAEWLLAFGSLQPNTDSQNAKTKPFLHAKDKACDLVGGAKKPWYEFQPEPTIVDVFDAQAETLKALKGILAKASKAQSVSHGEVLERLTALCDELAPDETAEALKDAQKP